MGSSILTTPIDQMLLTNHLLWAFAVTSLTLKNGVLFQMRRSTRFGEKGRRWRRLPLRCSQKFFPFVMSKEERNWRKQSLMPSYQCLTHWAHTTFNIFWFSFWNDSSHQHSSRLNTLSHLTTFTSQFHWLSSLKHSRFHTLHSSHSFIDSFKHSFTFTYSITQSQTQTFTS